MYIHTCIYPDAQVYIEKYVNYFTMYSKISLKYLHKGNQELETTSKRCGRKLREMKDKINEYKKHANKQM